MWQTVPRRFGFSDGLFHKREPMRSAVAAGRMPEQGFVRGKCQNLRHFDLVFVPLRNQHAAGLEHAEAFGEALADFISPVLSKLTVFLANHDFFPARTRCGGSKTTKLKLLSANGSAVKSSRTSGWISRWRRLPRSFR